MKYLFLVFAMFLGTSLFAQIPEVKEKKKCYEKYDASGKLIPKSQQRYAEWQCGKTVGVIDCGSELQYNPEPK